MDDQDHPQEKHKGHRSNRTKVIYYPLKLLILTEL